MIPIPGGIRRAATSASGLGWWATATAVVAAILAPSVQAKEVADYLSYSVGKLAIQPQFDLTESFTDNLFLSRGVNRVADLSTTLSPGLRLKYGSEANRQVSFEVGHDEILLLDNSDKNSRQDRLSLGIRYTLGRLRLEGSDSLSFLSSFVGGVLNQTRTLVDRRVWTDAYTLTYDWTAKTDFYVTGRHADTDYNEGLQIYDQTDLRATVGASYQYSQDYRFLVEGFYGQTQLDSNLAALPTPPGSKLYGGFVGARGNFTSKLSGNFRVGYEQRDYDGGGTFGAQTPALTVDLTYAFRPKTAATLLYSRFSSPSPQFAAQFQVVDAVSLTINQGLGTQGRWLLRGTVRYQLSEFDGGSTPGLDLSRTDSQWQAGLALPYQPQAWLTCTMAYDFDNYSYSFANRAAASTFVLPIYHANRVTLSVSVGF
jgi:hypothetical protein